MIEVMELARDSYLVSTHDQSVCENNFNVCRAYFHNFMTCSLVPKTPKKFLKALLVHITWSGHADRLISSLSKPLYISIT